VKGRAVSIFGNHRSIRIISIFIVSLAVWGLIGLIIGGWGQAIIFGLVGGIVFSALFIIPIIIQSRSNNSFKRKP